MTFYVLAVMHLKIRRVHIAGITPSPNATWMKQACRNLTDCEDGFLKDAKHLIVDRDTSFIAMREFLEQNTDTEESQPERVHGAVVSQSEVRVP